MKGANFLFISTPADMNIIQKIWNNCGILNIKVNFIDICGKTILNFVKLINFK